MSLSNNLLSRTAGAPPLQISPSPWWQRPWATLQALIGRHSRSSKVENIPCGLGIDGLPEGVDALPYGSPVALISGDTGGYLTWMPALLLDAVAAGPVFLLAGHKKWVDALLTHPSLNKAYSTGHLQIWMIGSGMTQQTLDHGLAPLTKDLAQAGLTSHQAIFCMPANTLFAGKNMHQLHRVSNELRHWCRGRHRPVVLCFAPTREDDGVAGMVRSMRSVFLHVASMGVEMGHPGLYLERWDSVKGAVFDERYGLIPKENGLRLGYDGSLTRGAVPELAQAIDQFDVFATRAIVHGKKGVPLHWKIVETDDDLKIATKNSIAATVLIDTGLSEDFEVKARLVHQLRLGHPRTLRILLRETQRKLRTHCEQALLGLGANAVLYREMGFSRLLQFLQDSGRRAYTGEVHIDYEQALGGFMPVAERGYQNPRKFCDLVRTMLKRTKGIGLSHCLVRTQVLSRIPHLDAIRASKVSRDGDLITADEDALYIFLFSCREPDLEDTLGRLFTLPLSQLFSDQSSDCTAEGIDLIISNLEAAGRKGLPDYSLFLQSVEPIATSIAAAFSVPTVGLIKDLHTTSPDAGSVEIVELNSTSHNTTMGVHRKAIGKRTRITLNNLETDL